MPFGLSGVSSSRSVPISRSNASRSTRLSSLLSDMFYLRTHRGTELTTPTQLVAQNVEVVSVHWLNEIECRAALSNHDFIRNFQRKTDLTIKRQCHLFLVRLQQQLDLGVVRHDDGTIRECKRTDRSNNNPVY